MRFSVLLVVVLFTSAASFRLERDKSFRAAIEMLRQSYPGLSLPYVPMKKTTQMFRFRRAPRRPLWDYRLRMMPNFF
ncbi:hypothetical protein QR680_013064 [Steinernema hermaphroditum]|uniref:Uncharacterized protein n=1 Tax=Steinernema hermaphroditum TaxID=289476 RepID=A0AA39I493_9BILA|nr:hypothetical protein QR680_013064 [Steinernema hermaphroditum]